MRGVALLDGAEIAGTLLSYLRCRSSLPRKWTFLKNVVLWFVHMKLTCYTGNRSICPLWPCTPFSAQYRHGAASRSTFSSNISSRLEEEEAGVMERL